MNKLTAERCKQLISQLTFERDNGGMSKQKFDYLEALEIALPLLEQQESDSDVFIVVRKPGKVPDIKRPVGDITDYLLQLYHHNPEAVCDVVTYRFAGVAGQWVQDGREMLAMLDVSLPTTDTYRQIENDGWIEWKGGSQPVSNSTLVEVKLQRDGYQGEDNAMTWDWTWRNGVDPIIAYRVIENDGREG